MNYEFLLAFVALSIINVVFSTVRQLVTHGNNKLLAALLSGGYFAFYNVMVIFTVADFPLWQKCAITFFCNVVGVYVVKWGEEKARKDKLWKVEATVQNVAYFTDYIKKECEKHFVPYSIINVENVNYVVFNFYCATQTKSKIVKQICDGCNAKYFVSESKTL
jgi:hypothetical protein